MRDRNPLAATLDGRQIPNSEPTYEGSKPATSITRQLDAYHSEPTYEGSKLSCRCTPR